MQDLYARMLLTRLVDECVQRLCARACREFVASCRGYEAAQVGSAACIEVGKDFTLPYYRDLGVVLTIGMTPEEVLRAYIQAYNRGSSESEQERIGSAHEELPHWGYHKHNMVTGSTPVATHILHAAGIAFAAKLRKAAAVTIAYCGDGATAKADFLEGISFAALHRLPLVIVCEQDEPASPLQSLPAHLEHMYVDGCDVVAVHTAMRAAMQHARAGQGPVLLTMSVYRMQAAADSSAEDCCRDPLYCCQAYLQERGWWDEVRVAQLHARLTAEVEQAMHHALGDLTSAGSGSSA
jgi:2-oxoisovalerate dehydrogenase E1 component subunit alpha